MVALLVSGTATIWVLTQVQSRSFLSRSGHVLLPGLGRACIPKGSHCSTQKRHGNLCRKCWGRPVGAAAIGQGLSLLIVNWPVRLVFVLTLVRKCQVRSGTQSEGRGSAQNIKVPGLIPSTTSSTNLTKSCFNAWERAQVVFG